MKSRHLLRLSRWAVVASPLLLATPTAANAAVIVTAYTQPAGTNVGTTTDAFDISRGTVVTGTSGYNSSSLPENALGGMSQTPDRETLVFADTPQALQTLSFRTAAPVTISGFNMYLAQDPASNGNVRGFDTVALFGSLDGTDYTNLGSVDLINPYQNGYGSNLILVTSTFASATYQFFRFEGTPYDQGDFSRSFPGGRLAELDAISDVAAPVPEPATWSMMIVGLGLIGTTMRRRVRASVRFA